MINKKLSGMGVALITPFRNDDTIDFHALGRLIEYQIESKTDYLVICGTTAETPTLSDEEIIEIKQFVVNKVAGRCPIVIGIGGNNTKAVVNKISTTDLSGIDAILSVTPYYNKPTQEGLFLHYAAVCKASPVPVILYNVPGRTGVNMTAETTVRIAKELPNACAIKDASCNLEQAELILQSKPADFMLISGDDESTFDLIKSGAAGVISVIGNAFPREFRQMVQLALKGDYENAGRMHHSFEKLFHLAFVEGNPAGVKSMLTHMEYIENELRLPLVSTTAETHEMIKMAINELKHL